MTILESLLNAVFGSKPTPGETVSEFDVAAYLDGLVSGLKQPLNWRTSVVDLMKALGMDSSLKERDALAQEMHYPAGIDGSVTAMNVWLHKEIMRRVADNGGKVPAELL